jgi:hypothetical protein
MQVPHLGAADGGKRSVGYEYDDLHFFLSFPGLYRLRFLCPTPGWYPREMRILFSTYTSAFQNPGGGENVMLKLRSHPLKAQELS